MSRDAMLDRVRNALGRTTGQEPAPPPHPYSSPRRMDVADRPAVFTRELEALAAKVIRCPDRAGARDTAASLLAGRRAVASPAEYLRTCGITGLDGVQSEFTSPAEYREACSQVDVGVTGADYALADTGSLVMLSGVEESRLVSLMPPAHIAVVPVSRLLDGLDELIERVPQPASITSSMVIITGPSRTADIEQILVRGVHGPGDVTVILVDE